jgi:hypothetical protein
MVACFAEDGALDRVGHHVTGDRTGRDLLPMRILDLAVHAWDLARAIGADESLDDDVVAFLLDHTDGDAPGEATPQDRLLHRLGRHPNTPEEVR